MGSSVWRAVTKARKLLLEGFQLKVGRGEVSFFFDKWLSHEPLCRKVPWVATQDIALKVKDVCWQGVWHWDCIYTLLPHEVRQSISRSGIIINESIPDCITWKGALNGVYTAKSGYAWLIENDMVHQNFSSWNWIWKLRVPYRLNFFLWLVCHHAIPTNTLRWKRRCAHQDVCERCGIDAETVFHCLRDCDKASAVWRKLDVDGLNWFWNENDIMKWIQSGLKNLGIIFVTVAWWIWRARCAECFNSDPIPTTEAFLLASRMQEDILRSFGGTMLMIGV
ncbi:hypothetical protein RIF29_22313 [Crotalaria pallida]|uniref:Reverse transcriptase zinc-binding domain-containing protein n=1 Tax=Crotalaria pallida TaxID=3830 RepID=A0AAN9F8K6_CROPI